MTDPIILQLALEELVFLLRGEKIEAMPGLDQQFLNNLDRDHQDLAFAVADRTLRARRYLFRVSASDRIIEPTVAGVLHEASHPGAIVERWTTTPGNGLRATFSITSKFVVERTEVEPGIHRLVAVAGVADGVELLLQQVNLNQNATMGREATLPRDIWNTILDTLGSSPEEAQAQLSVALSSDLSEQTFGALTDAAPRYTFVASRENQPESRQVMLVQSATHIVLIATKTSGVLIRSIDASSARQALEDFAREAIAPLMGTEAAR